MKSKGILALLLVFVMVGGLFAGCASKSLAGDAFNSIEGEMVMDDAYAPADSITTNGEGGSTVLPENQKWIRTLYLDTETEDMTPLLAEIDKQVAALGGYMEEREVRNGSKYSEYRRRYADLVIRIPVERVDEFVKQVSGISNVISTNETVENITLTYVATESRVNALEAEEQRLLELMAQAENMSDLLEIEARLTDVRYELEKMTSQLRQYDNLVDFATVHLSIDEVQVLTPVEEETMWQRISGGFVESLKGVGNFLKELVIWFLAKLPYLVLVAGIVLVLVLIIKKSQKKKPKKQKPFPTEPQEKA